LPNPRNVASSPTPTRSGPSTVIPSSTKIGTVSVVIDPPFTRISRKPCQ
jgi:hypothetical protein